MPCSVCSKRLAPRPCRVMYEPVPRTGSGVGHQNSPVRSSRTYSTSPVPSDTGSLFQVVMRFSCELCAHVQPIPASEMSVPNSAFASTFTHGAGVTSPA